LGVPTLRCGWSSRPKRGGRQTFSECLRLSYIEDDTSQEAFFLTTEPGYCSRMEEFILAAAEARSVFQAQLDAAQTRLEECQALDQFYAELESLQSWRSEGVVHAGLPTVPESTSVLGYLTAFSGNPYTALRAVIDCDSPGFGDDSGVLDASTDVFVNLDVDKIEGVLELVISGDVLSASDGASLGRFRAEFSDPVVCELDVGPAPYLSLY